MPRKVGSLLRSLQPGLIQFYAIAMVLAVAVLYMGIHPKPFTDVMNVSVADFLKHVSASKL